MAEEDRLFDVAVIGSGLGGSTLGAILARQGHAVLGFHRYFAHHSFRIKTGRVVQFLLAFVGGMAVMRSALWWAHLRWFMARGNQRTRTELACYPELRWLDRHEWFPILCFMAFCYALGGFPGWVWGANVSTLVLCHVTFALNSVTHVFGGRAHETSDDSTSLLPLAIATFGEGWHNSHHRFPTRARIGESAWQVHISWGGIRLMELLGLAREVRW